MKTKFCQIKQSVQAFCKGKYKKHPTLYWGALSFLLPAFCLLLTLIVRGYVLFGDKTFFAPLYDYSFLSEISLAKGSLSFASLFFGGENGFDIFTVLASILPFSIPFNSVLVALLRAGLLGLSFFVFAKAVACKNFPSLCGSVLYSLCAFSFVSSQFTGAYTLLLLLPLCAYALVLQADKRLISPLFAVLICGFIFDARNGFILLLCSIGLFFFVRFALQKGNNVPFWRAWVELFSACVAAFLVGFSAMAVLYRQFLLSDINFENTSFDLLQLFVKMLPATYDGISEGSTPYLWCGLLPILCVPYYFVSKEIPKTEKIGYAIALGVSAFTMLYSIADACFDLFGQSAILSYAQAPLFVCLAVYGCARALSVTNSKESTTSVYCAFGILALLLMLSQYVSFEYLGKTYPSHLNSIWGTLFLGGVLLFATIALLTSHTAKKRQIFSVVLLGCICIEMIFGNAKLLKSFTNENGYYSRSELSAYEQTYLTLQKEIKKFDNALFRNEIFSSFESGLSAEFGYETLAQTQANEAYAALLGQLGLHREGNTLFYAQNSAAIDSLLSYAYLADFKAVEAEEEEKETKEENKTIKKIKDIWRAIFPKEMQPTALPESSSAPSKLYETVYDKDGMLIYKNPYALPLLFSCLDAVKELDFFVPSEKDLIYYSDDDAYGFKDETMEGKNYYDTPAKCLNALYSALTGIEDVSLFTALTKTSSTLYNSTKTVYSDVGMTRYTVSDKEKYSAAFLTLSVQIDNPCTVLLTLPTYIGREAKIQVNGIDMGTVNANNSADCSFINLGYREEGVLSVHVIFGENQEGEFFLKNDECYFYTPNDVAFASLMEQFDFGSAECIEQSENKIKASFTAPAGQTTVFTTLPYSEKAIVKVDGKKVQTYANMGAFLGFDLPSDGTHEISISLKGELNLPENALIRPIGFVFMLSAVGHDVFAYLKKKKREEADNA